MANPPESEPKKVSILVLDQAGASADALRQVLDSEGWSVKFIADTKILLTEMRTGEWSLVIANIGLLGVNSPGYMTLRELATVPPEDGGRVRCLFLVPELIGKPVCRNAGMANFPTSSGLTIFTISSKKSAISSSKSKPLKPRYVRSAMNLAACARKRKTRAALLQCSPRAIPTATPTKNWPNMNEPKRNLRVPNETSPAPTSAIRATDWQTLPLES